MSDEVTYGYIPPTTYSFASMAEALGHLIAAVCSSPAARFLEFVEKHIVDNDESVGRFRPVYTLAEWANGTIDRRAYEGRGPHAFAELQRWAMAMIELNSIFRTYGVDDPIAFLEEKGLISRSSDHNGWDANLDEIDAVLGLNIKGRAIDHLIVRSTRTGAGQGSKR